MVNSEIGKCSICCKQSDESLVDTEDKVKKAVKLVRSLGHNRNLALAFSSGIML